MRKYNKSGRLSKVETLSPRKIKQYIMEARGYTTAEYQKEYDILRNRVRNYERAIGVSSREKIAVNKLLYDIVRREVYAAEKGYTTPQYTREEEAIFRFTSATTSSGRRQSAREIELGRAVILGAGAITITPDNVNADGEILSYKVQVNPENDRGETFGRFGAFINKTTLIPVKSRLESFMTRYYNQNGELPPPQTLNRYLASMADELHALQDNDRQAHGGFYRRNGRRGGS